MSRSSVHALAAGIVVAMLSGVTGCAASTATATPAASGPAASASAAPARKMAVPAVPKPRTAAPALATTGTGWPAIITSLAGYGQWVLANPDPALVGAVATPGCAMATLMSQQADGLLRDKAYLKPAAPVFGAVTGPVPVPGAAAAVPGTTVTLHVTASRPAEPVISRTGVAISMFDPLPPTALQITLDLGSDNRWRFCTVNAQADTGESQDPTVPLL